nr:hypothetical protein [uncultured Pseudomonas sp.]
MRIFRIEADVTTGIRSEISQSAYRMGDKVIVLDDGIEPPDGFEKFDPSASSGIDESPEA